jgi:crotonobetainyl-CoA:carnitine CoA-transferase CaiB-like acyl-CoA transferase
MAEVLDDVCVLDLSWGIAGPMTTMLLADHGAQVTRIEPPGGDPYRSQLGYSAWNRGKRSAVLDLEQAADKETLLELARRADVLVESFAPGVTDRLGIDYAALSHANPRLIYCSITGYGRNNKHSQRPGYDALVAARSGLQWEQRGWVGGSAPPLAGAPPLFPDFEVPQEAQQGPAREGPLFSASHFPSLGACYAATTAISAALRARERTGRGQWVETSLLRGALSAGVLAYGRAEKLNAPGFMSWIGDSRAPKGLFQCSDGRWVHCWVPNPRFVLSAAQGGELNATPDLTVREDPERIGIAPEELFVLAHYWEPMAKAVSKFTADAWTQAGAVSQICIQKVRSPEEGLADPLLLADGCVAELDDPELGKVRSVGISYELANSRGTIAGPAPRVGEHTAQVKAEAEEPFVPAPSAPPGEALPGGPLEGITVLDFGLAVAGPYGAQVLSDLGANVIKVNAPYDWYWHSNQLAMACNRGKRSIAINLKHENAKETIRRLVESADVVIHNMRYRAAVNLGIDYDSLKTQNPRLVYCHTRGFERGPRESLPGNDQTGACLAGVSWEDGGCNRGGRPFWSLTNMGDTGNGYLAAIAISQALYEREKTGLGQWVETAIVNAQLLNTSHTVARPDGSGFERPMLDADHMGFSAGQRLYETSEGWLCLSLAKSKHWEALFAVLGGDLGSRFATESAREAGDAELIAALEARFAKREACSWQETLDAAGVPCEVSSDRFGIELFDDAEMREGGFVAEVDHPMAGKLGQVGLAFEFSDTPVRVQGPPMLVGEHTREILAEFGHSEAEVEALFESGAVEDQSVYPSLAGTRAAPKSPWDSQS